MKTISVYTFKELKENFPDGFASLMKRHKELVYHWDVYVDDIHVALERLASIFNCTLKDWSISPFSPSYLQVDQPVDPDEYFEDFDTEAEEPQHNWSEYTDLCLQRAGYKRHKGSTEKDREWNFSSDIPLLEELLEVFYKAIDEDGPKRAFNYAVCSWVQKYFENEYNEMISEDYAEAYYEECYFLEDGTEVDRNLVK